MTTLTDRYIYAVTRSVPESQREDIDRELRASIGDDVDARTEAGVDAAAAERDALAALGDPAPLAASYAQRPNALIGPVYYFDYLRLLKALYSIVLPVVVIAAGLANAMSGAGIGQVIGGAVATAVSVAVHIGFWTTLVFAVHERTGGKGRPIGEWRPELLPEVRDPKSGATLPDLIASWVFLLFFAGALVWQQLSSVFADAAGRPVPVLQPELWAFWLPYVFVLIALELVFAVALYRRRRWTWPLAAANVVLNAAFLVPALLLTIGDRIVNPEFVQRLTWGATADTVLTPILILMFTVIAVGDALDGIVKARRASEGIGR